jgi:hypothetical protein
MQINFPCESLLLHHPGYNFVTVLLIISEVVIERKHINLTVLQQYDTFLCVIGQSKAPRAWTHVVQVNMNDGRFPLSCPLSLIRSAGKSFNKGDFCCVASILCGFRLQNHRYILYMRRSEQQAESIKPDVPLTYVRMTVAP